MNTQSQTILLKIAKQYLGVETLESRNSDRLDFHDLSVRSIEAALKAAFEAGRTMGQEVLLKTCSPEPGLVSAPL